MDVPPDESALPELPPPRDRLARRRRRRRRRGWRVLRPEYLLLAACGMAAFLYIFIPLLLRWWQPEASWLAPLDTVTSDIRLRAMQTFTIAWLFFFGASIGSFLNVVIYRSPRGKTLLGPSRCPRCQQKIRARHNIPVLGWLLLGGRCFDCRLPISARYPLVEAVIGSVFLSLAAGELFTGGANLPVREPNYYTGIGMIDFDPQWDLIAIYAVHALLVSVLISWGLIQYDGQRIPLGYSLFIGMALLTLVTVFPAAHPVPWNYQLDAIAHVPPRFDGLVAGLVGLTAGGIAGLAFALAARRGPLATEAARRARGREQVFAVAVVGLALGWHAIASMALLAAVLRALHVAIWPVNAPQQARLLPMAVAVWIGILLWRPLSSWSWWPAPERSWIYHLFSLSLAALLTAMTSSGAARTREEPTTPESEEPESGKQPASNAVEIED